MPADMPNAWTQLFRLAKPVASRSIPMAKLFSAAAGISMILLARPALAGPDDNGIVIIGTIPINPVGVDKSDPDYVSTGPDIPADFDPRTATDEELENLDLPPRPTDPRALDAWYAALSAPQAPLPENAVVEVTNVVNEPDRPAKLPADNTLLPKTMPVNSVGLSKDDPNYSASFKGFDAGFDPRSASDEELAKYNLLRPRDPRLLNDWYEALSRPVVPVPKNAVFQLRYGRHGLDQPAQLPADNTDTIPAATRPNSSPTREENENIFCRHVQRTLQCWTIAPKP